MTTINLETRECLDTYSLQRPRITSGNTARAQECTQRTCISGMTREKALVALLSVCALTSADPISNEAAFGPKWAFQWTTPVIRELGEGWLGGWNIKPLSRCAALPFMLGSIKQSNQRCPPKTGNRHGNMFEHNNVQYLRFQNTSWSRYIR